MKARAKVAGTEEIKLSITPLIDVTFLLLIFFLCAMRFKTLERKVQAWLPTTHGMVPTDFRKEQVTIDVRLGRKKGETMTRVSLLGQTLGVDDRGFAELDRKLASIHADSPDLPGKIDAKEEVPHGDVVRCIDSFMKAGVLEIEFVGTPRKGSERRP
ncbi:MAG: ExbD/TolR family protein [Planctomycetota bacterium]